MFLEGGREDQKDRKEPPFLPAVQGAVDLYPFLAGPSA